MITRGRQGPLIVNCMPARGPEVFIVAGTLALLLTVYALIFLRYLPNDRGRVGGDYSLWLPDLLVGYFWHLGNGLLTLPWFSPAECGGVPFYADPQVPYLSVPQFLTFVIPPVEAVRVSFLLYAAAGFLGTFYLSRITFRLSCSASLLAATLFMFNNFYAARMLIGHLTYETFMLAPILAAAILRPAEGMRFCRSLVGTGIGGLLIAVMIQEGAVHIVLPVFLTVAILVVMQGLRGALLLPAACRLIGAIMAGCSLSASKLAAGIGFVAHFSRDNYSLPGISGLTATCWRVLQTVFFGPPTHPESAAVNSTWALQRHEWEYGISVVPLLLILAWLAVEVANRRPPKRPAFWSAFFVLLTVPIALNWYQPEWNAFLKALPYFGSSSNLLRWFAAYILPASLGAALALDAVAPIRLRSAAATIAIFGVLATNSLTGRGFYGANGQGNYNVATIETAWRVASKVHTGPRITAIRMLTTPKGQISVAPNRQDAFIFGYSQLFCYEPLFGYGLERFPLGSLHPGASLVSKAGVLNVKNPACYVFPGANGCSPGDPFPEARIDDAQAFLDYEPFPLQQPLWDRLSNGLNLVAAFTFGLAAIAIVGSKILQAPHALALLPDRGPRILLWPSAAHRKIVSMFGTGKPPTVVADEEPALPPASQLRPAGLIEIVLPNGVIVRVDTQET
jgi:hypothetical protein